MENLNQLFVNKRTKILTIFITAIALFLETPLRFFAHRIAEILLSGLREIFLTGTAELIAREIFIQGSPFFFIYLPTLFGLIIIAKDGFQKLDWIIGPFLIGILLKAGIYGNISLKYQNGEFWRLVEAGAPSFLLKFFIFLFFLNALIGIFIWMRDIIRS